MRRRCSTKAALRNCVHKERAVFKHRHILETRTSHPHQDSPLPWTPQAAVDIAVSSFGHRRPKACFLALVPTGALCPAPCVVLCCVGRSFRPGLRMLCVRSGGPFHGVRSRVGRWPLGRCCWSRSLSVVPRSVLSRPSPPCSPGSTTGPVAAGAPCGGSGCPLWWVRPGCSSGRSRGIGSGPSRSPFCLPGSGSSPEASAPSGPSRPPPGPSCWSPPPSGPGCRCPRAGGSGRSPISAVPCGWCCSGSCCPRPGPSSGTSGSTGSGTRWPGCTTPSPSCSTPWGPTGPPPAVPPSPPPSTMRRTPSPGPGCGGTPPRPPSGGCTRSTPPPCR